MTDFSKIEKNIKDGNIDSAIFEYEKHAYETSYEKLINGWILEKEDIYNMLDFFVRIKETEKINRITKILNKYYPNYLTEKFEELIVNEEYEKCEILKEYIK